MSNNILFLTYYFPPGTSSGVFRPLKFVKYLKKSNWNPIVLTIKEEYYQWLDESLHMEIPGNLEIYRLESLQPQSHYDQTYKRIYHEVQIPDHALGSIMHFVLKGLEIIKQKKIDLIFCTIPPYSLALAGKILKEITGIPLILDYRDGWTEANEITFRTEEGKLIQKYLERSLIDIVDGIVTVDSGIENGLRKIGYNCPIKIIRNGFDLEDSIYCDISPYDIEENFINMTYCGHIYKKYIPYIEKLLKAIDILNSQSGKTKIKFYLVGHFQDEADLQKLCKYEFVIYKGHKSYKESLKYIRFSDCNIAIMTSDISVGGKYYNLIAFSSFILTIINNKNENLKNLLEEYPNKLIFDLEVNIDELVNSLNKIRRSGRDFNNNLKMVPEKYKDFSRVEQSKLLKEFFGEFLKSNY